MRNDCVITSNSNSVYLSVASKLNKSRRMYLVMGAATCLFLLLAVLCLLDYASVHFVLIPSTALSMVAIFLLAKYTLWKLYGKETLIVGTKSISWQHDYGFFLLRPLVVPCDDWTVYYNKKQQEYFGEVGQIIVKKNINRNSKGIIYKTTLPIHEEDAEKFINALEAMIDKQHIRFPKLMDN